MAKKKVMTIWKRVPRSQLKQYYTRQEPVLLTHKRIDANDFDSHENAGLMWDWESSSSTFELLSGHEPARLICPSGYLTSRQMAVNAWRENWCDNDYSEPVFWVKHYALMRKAKKHYA